MKAKDRQFIFGILLMLNSILLNYLWFQYKTPIQSSLAIILFWAIGCIVCIRTFKD